MNYKDNNDIRETLSRTKIKFGFTGLATLNDIDALNEYLAHHPEITIFYRKVSVNSLRIVEG